MLNRVGKSCPTPGYVRHKVSPKGGSCGYTAFGLTREAAYELIVKNLSNDIVRNLLKPVVQEQLLMNNFFTYLKSIQVLGEDIYPLHFKVRILKNIFLCRLSCHPAPSLLMRDPYSREITT